MRLTAALFVATFVLVADPAAAADDADPQPVPEGPGVVLLPGGDFYPPNTPDPHRRGFAYQRLTVDPVGIADSGEKRFGLKMGGRVGVLRLHSREREDRGIQLGVEMGFYGQFDSLYSQDNIGWDGFYGLILTSGLTSRLAGKVGFMHVSSHLGDEYAERTDRRRIGYTREELVAGLSFQVVELLRLYGEVGWAYTLRSDELQSPRRGQLGAVLGAPRMAGGRLGFYGGVDVSTWEERDWRVDVALQGGLLFVSGNREWRFGVERYEGRPPLGEFFDVDETYTAFGIWLDLR